MITETAAFMTSHADLSPPWMLAIAWAFFVWALAMVLLRYLKGTGT